MTDLDNLINTPIGAVFFVSGAISVFVLLAIFILKKGTEMHSVLGYIYMFGLSFANYAAAMAYYDGLLPLSAVILTVPLSTVSLVAGLLAIVPKNKSTYRIRVHIISMVCSTVAVLLGTLINWYHFQVNLLHAIDLVALFELVLLSIPILLVASTLILHFGWDVRQYATQRNTQELIDEFNDQQSKTNSNVRNSTSIIYNAPRSLENDLNHAQESG